MKSMAMVAMVMAVVWGGVGVALSAAGTTVLYSEDFESYADGTLLAAPAPGGPGWTVTYDGGDGKPQVEANESPYNSSPPFETKAVYTHTTAGGNQYQISKPFTNPRSGDLRLTFKAYARSDIDQHNNRFGLSKTVSGSACGVYTANNVSLPNKWRYMFGDIGGADGDFVDGANPAFFDTTVTVTIDFDGRNLKARATIDNGSSILDSGLIDIDSTVAELDHLRMLLDTRGGWHMYGVDEIVLESTQPDVPIWGEVLYQEDFESGTHNQSITNPPFNWTADRVGDKLVTTNTWLDGLAFDGDSGDAALCGHSGTIPPPRPGRDIYELAAKLYAFDGNNGGIGLMDRSVSAREARVRLFYKDEVNSVSGLGGWYLAAVGLGGVNTNLTLTGVADTSLGKGACIGYIRIDTVNKTVEGRVEYNGGILSKTIGYTGDVYGIDAVGIRCDMRFANALDVDDITIQVTPSGGTMVLVM